MRSLLLALLVVIVAAAPAAGRVWQVPASDSPPAWTRSITLTVPSYHGTRCMPDTLHPLTAEEIAGLVFVVHGFPIPAGTEISAGPWRPLLYVSVSDLNASSPNTVAAGDTLVVLIEPPSPGLWWIINGLVGSSCLGTEFPLAFIERFPDPPATNEIPAGPFEFNSPGWK